MVDEDRRRVRAARSTGGLNDVDRPAEGLRNRTRTKVTPDISKQKAVKAELEDLKARIARYESGQPPFVYNYTHGMDDVSGEKRIELEKQAAETVVEELEKVLEFYE